MSWAQFGEAFFPQLDTSGSPYTITVTRAVVAWTGRTVTISKSRFVTVSRATFAWTGRTVNITVVRVPTVVSRRVKPHLFLGLGLGLGRFEGGAAVAAQTFVSTATLDLPAGKQHFWSLVKSTGYAGKAIRVQRSSDSTELDIGFDGNQLADTAAILNFVGGGTGYVSKVYDQVGSTDMVQATQSLMPIICTGGVINRNASGVVSMRGCTGGRYMLAAGASAGSQEYGLCTLAQNNVDQTVPTTNQFSPILGLSTPAGSSTQRWHLIFGNRSSATARNLLFELESVSTASNEISGWPDPIAINTTGLITVNSQLNALTGGPGAGSTLYYQRGSLSPGTNLGTSDNASNDPTAITGTCDMRLFALYNGGWTTNSSNGADANVTLCYTGLPMTNAQRQALEGAITDKFSRILYQLNATTVPALGSTGEAWDFSQYASDKVVGVKGNCDLNFQTAANGSTFSLTTSDGGFVGVYEGVTNNFSNDFEGSNTFGWDQRSFTMWAIVTIDDTPAARIFDFIGQGTGALTVTTIVNRYVSSLLSKDHSPLCAYSLDGTTPAASPPHDFTNMMVGQNDPNTGDRAWFPFSPFWGGGFLGINVPAHDNNSNHPPFYTKKHFLGDAQTLDQQQYAFRQGVPFMILMKHKPHPSYDYGSVGTSGTNLLWRNKATLIVKAANLGGLDGFGKVPGAWSDQTGRVAHVVCDNTFKFRHYGGENLNSFKGWSHAMGFIGKFTSDAEDQALFYKLTNPQNASGLT